MPHVSRHSAIPRSVADLSFSAAMSKTDVAQDGSPCHHIDAGRMRDWCDCRWGTRYIVRSVHGLHVVQT